MNVLVLTTFLLLFVCRETPAQSVTAAAAPATPAETAARERITAVFTASAPQLACSSRFARW